MKWRDFIIDRKEIVKVLCEHFGAKAEYMGTPSFAYQIKTEEETYIIDKAGKITKINLIFDTDRVYKTLTISSN